MIDLKNKDSMVTFASLIFWGIILAVLFSITQPMAPAAQAVHIMCMAIAAFSDRGSIKDIGEALGTFWLIALGPLSLLTILSIKLAKGYYRKHPWKWNKSLGGHYDNFK